MEDVLTCPARTGIKKRNKITLLTNLILLSAILAWTGQASKKGINNLFVNSFENLFAVRLCWKGLLSIFYHRPEVSHHFTLTDCGHQPSADWQPRVSIMKGQEDCKYINISRTVVVSYIASYDSSDRGQFGNTES